METGSVVKAIYDFQSDFEGELCLEVGDIVQIQGKVDGQWLYGICNGRSGRFPYNFVVPLSVPNLEPGQQLFAATNDFCATEKDDLQLERGDLILGLEEVDSNWWRGQVCNQKFRYVGIFPLTHVWKLDPKPFVFQQVLEQSQVSIWGVATMSLKAQLPDEIDLFENMPVHITEIVDKDWYRGSCNGKTGKISSAFVVLNDARDLKPNIVVSSNSFSQLNPVQVQDTFQPCAKDLILNRNLNDISQPGCNNFSTMQNESSAVNTQSQKCEVDRYGYDSLNSGITPYGRVLSPFQADYPNELSVSVGQLVKLIRHVDNSWIEGEYNGKTGLFPKRCVEVIVDCEHGISSSGNADFTKTENLVKEEVLPTDTFGRVIFEFKSQMEGDLNLNVGDTITLLRQFNRNWYEAITDSGQIGLCPSNYVEVIGNEKPLNTLWKESAQGTSESSWNFKDVVPYNKGQQYSENNMNNLFECKAPCSTLLKSDSSVLSYHCEKESNLNHLSRVDENFGHHNNTFKDVGAFSSSRSFVRPEKHNVPCSVDPKTVNYEECAKAAVNDFAGARTSLDFGRLESNYLLDISKTSSLDRKSVSKPAPIVTQMSVPYFSSDSNSSSYDSLSGVEVRHKPPLSRQSSLGSDRGSYPRRSAPPLPTSSTYSSNMATSASLKQEELRRNVQEKEQELQRFERSVGKLRLGLSCEGGDINNFSDRESLLQIKDIEWQIKVLQDEISVLKGQMKSSSRSSLCSLTEEQKDKEDQVQLRRKESDKRRGEEKRKKTLEQRHCIIMELLQTEKDYLHDMKICYQIFLKDPEPAKALNVDLGTLFGNLDEVIDIAERLLARLNKCCRDLDPQEQAVGDCFVDFTEDLKEVYGIYCRNHDEVNPLLKKYESSQVIQDFLNKGVESMKAITNCFDLPSVLIKPVQRILKYPLLLNELDKVTEDTHIDKKPLQQSVALMADVATAINEFKRRKDLVFKYRNDADTSLSFRLSKLTLHSLIKKSARFSARLSSSLGLSSSTKDDQFEQLTKRFSTIEKTVKIFLKDITSFVNQMQDLHKTGFTMAEDIADFYQERKNQKEVDQLRSAHRIIFTQFWQDYNLAIEKRVVSVLKRLLEMYHGPQNLIQKRNDKLLDYDTCMSKCEKNKDNSKLKILSDDLILAKHTYEALNTQLVDELPLFCTLSVQILEDCIRAFLHARKVFIARSASEMINLMELPSVVGNKGDLLENFKVKHRLVSDSMSQLSLAPKQLFPSPRNSLDPKRISPKSSTNNNSRVLLGSSDIKSSHQSASQRAYVQSHFQELALYTAVDSYTASDLLDLTIYKGDLVGVLKQHDPSGNPNRWFVDNGVAKGFVPARLISLWKPQGGSGYVSPQTSSVNSSLCSVGSQPQHSQQSHSRSSSFSSVTSTPPSAHSSRSASFSSPYLTPNTSLTEHRYYSAVECSSSNLMDLKQDLENRASPRTSSPNYAVVEEFDPCQSQLQNADYDHVDYNASTTYESVMYDKIPSASCEMTDFSDHRYEVLPDDEEESKLSEKVPAVAGDNYENLATNADVSGIAGESEYYYASFPFSAIGPHQLTLVAGQVVLVLHKQDLHGNPEWFFVEDRYGNQGYAPRNYLAKYNNQ